MDKVYRIPLPDTLADNEDAIPLTTWEATDGWYSRLEWWPGQVDTYGPFPDTRTALGEALIHYYCEMDPDVTHNSTDLITLPTGVEAL